MGETNIFEVDAQVLTNPINAVGVMGAGLALQFKNKLPVTYYNSYRAECDSGMVAQLRYHLWIPDQTIEEYPMVYGAVTKLHWKDKSTRNDIHRTVGAMCALSTTHKWKSIAIPRLGCGLGGMDWSQIGPDIEEIILEMGNTDTEFLILARSATK